MQQSGKQKALAVGIAGMLLVVMISLAEPPTPSSVPKPPPPQPPDAPKPPEGSNIIGWPIERTEIKRVGDGVTDSRPGTQRPHHGVDLFAPAGTLVRAARAGRVKRVVDGRASSRESSQKAGLWVDVAAGSQLDRYLHLGEARVKEGQSVARGDVIGTIAPANTSGAGPNPHLHFEVRASDYNGAKQSYGDPIQPKFGVV